ncbi:MAG: hypothetical protein ACE5FD_17400 [Anaerolineae bacterium]
MVRLSFGLPILSYSSGFGVLLPYTAAPDEQFVIGIDFTLRLVGSNRGFNGTLGQIEDVLTLAHFHPTLVATQNGEWDLATVVHGLGNLAENSFFQIRINAPEQLTILSNGREIRRAITTDSGSTRQLLTLAAGPANQFYLTAGERFTTVVSDTVGETTINSYADADYLLENAQTALTIAVAALRVYNAEFGTYPFTELDIIDLPMSGLTEATMTHPGVVLLYFEGGGGGWDAGSCRPGSTFYDPDVGSEEDPTFRNGIFNLDHPDNPFRDYHAVFIPSCNGDVHWGNSVQNYPTADGETLAIPSPPGFPPSPTSLPILRCSWPTTTSPLPTITPTIPLPNTTPKTTTYKCASTSPTAVRLTAFAATWPRT